MTKHNKAHTATANRISKRYGSTYEPDRDFDIICDDFVIEVKYQNGQTWLDRAGNYLPYGAEVTERYSRIDDNHIRYTATIVEPETYTEPWEISMVLYRQIEEDAQILEFNCVEFVEELLHGHLRREPLD